MYYYCEKNVRHLEALMGVEPIKCSFAGHCLAVWLQG